MSHDETNCINCGEGIGTRADMGPSAEMATAEIRGSKPHGSTNLRTGEAPSWQGCVYQYGHCDCPCAPCKVGHHCGVGGVRPSEAPLKVGDTVQIHGLPELPGGGADPWNGALGSVDTVYPPDCHPNMKWVATVHVMDRGTQSFSVEFLRRLDEPVRATSEATDRGVEPGVAQSSHEGPEGATGNHVTRRASGEEQRPSKPSVAGSSPAPRLDSTNRRSETATDPRVDEIVSLVEDNMPLPVEQRVRERIAEILGRRPPVEVPPALGDWGDGVPGQLADYPATVEGVLAGLYLHDFGPEEAGARLDLLLRRPTATDLHYACVNCATPIAASGMCEACSRAYGIGRGEALVDALDSVRRGGVDEYGLLMTAEDKIKALLATSGQRRERDQKKPQGDGSGGAP